jgi:hypothetical protein
MYAEPGKFMRRWILFLLVLTGCSQHKGGSDIKFLLPWRTADGRYVLQEVTLSTLSSPFELRGEAAEIYFQSPFSNAGYSGSLARPHLIKSGDVYVPQDAESYLAVTAYAQFERLFRYEQKIRTGAQLSWPRRVGVELNMQSDNGQAHNNAHYFSSLDVIGILPYSFGGVPIALNQGIVAHEHFHSHFQSQVLNPLHAVDSMVSSLENMFYPLFPASTGTVLPLPADDPTSPKKLNNIVLRAWNEGLADFFASIYTDQNEFFSISVPGLDRALNGREAKLQNGTSFVQWTRDNHPPAAALVSHAYVQGTLLARLMYSIAHSGIEPPEKFLIRILSNLQAIPARVQPTYGTFVLDFESVVPVLLGDLKLDKGGCAQLKSALSDELIQGSFGQCAGL